MLGDTFKVLVLSVLTVVVFHLLLQFAQQRMGRAGGIGFGSAMFGRYVFGQRVPRRRRGAVKHWMTPVHESFTNAPGLPSAAEDDDDTTTDDATHDSQAAPASPASTDLESELKAWMQRESSSWAAHSSVDSSSSVMPNDVSAPDNKSTSIDSVFAAQEVQMDDVAPIDVTVSNKDARSKDARSSAEKVTTSVSPTKGASGDRNNKATAANGAAYCNPMNTGEWGGDGLMAFDTMQDSYATV